jgi:acyl-CoA reductase-like NAD-dependent aldehyde dehydrogenase
MTHGNPQDQTPGCSFQGISSAEELLVIARIHHREAKQLFENAQKAQAEDRQEEARLLTDLAIARRERADELDKAARGESGDPIVGELLESEEVMCKNYTPKTPTYIAPDGPLPPGWLETIQPPPLGPVARAVAWIGSWIT